MARPISFLISFNFLLNSASSFFLSSYFFTISLMLVVPTTATPTSAFLSPPTSLVPSPAYTTPP